MPKKQVVFVALREYCEVAALKLLIRFAKERGFAIEWHLVSFPVNTDFRFLSLERAFEGYSDVVVRAAEGVDLSSAPLVGFKTDMKHLIDGFVKLVIPIHDILACSLVSPRSPTIDVLVSNIKVKSPVSAEQAVILERLARLPYQRVVLVPRHPLEPDELAGVILPQGLDLVNTMGELEGLCASSRLIIMGRIFSEDAFDLDDDHNPLEATIRSHALCGTNTKIPPAYEWLYKQSGLIHQCATVEEVFQGIPEYYVDADLEHKLDKRREWIEGNRGRLDVVLSQILSLA